MALRISTGSVHDVDLLRELWLAIRGTYAEVLGDVVGFVPEEESWIRRREKYLVELADPASILLLARRGEDPAPVGYLVGAIEPGEVNALYDLAPAIGDVAALAVLPEHRGQGIGTALMEAAKAHFVAHGCSRWALVVADGHTQAIALYEHLGFRPWERQLTAPLPTPDR